MQNVKVLTLLGIGLLVAPFAHAQYGGQVDPGYGNPNPGYANPDQGYADQGYGGPGYVDQGPPPACPYGYYPSYPYGCAPYGYYGPS
jgi:hypothetical protein